MPKVSIIVPIYNVEKYIERCARSLFEQTFEDVEYIFVDDGTLDNSVTILLETLSSYPHRKNQVKILRHTHNMGLPEARKTGTQNATGVYILHCDSDDWMESDMLHKMYETLVSFDSDAVVCDFFINDTPIKSSLQTSVNENCRDEYVSNAVAGKGMQSVWRVMVKRELCANIPKWPEYSQGEDIAMVVQMAYSCKDIRYLHKHLYHWRDVDSSLTHSSKRESIIKRYEGACDNTRLIENFIKEIVNCQNVYDEEIVSLKVMSGFYLRPLLRQGEELGLWRNSFPEVKLFEVFKNRYITFRNKVEYCFDKYAMAFLVEKMYHICWHVRRKP